jgi:hypothetical protein
MSSRGTKLGSVATLLVATGCATPPAQTSLRSPSLDYPPAQAQQISTSDGETLGADRQAPADKLANGARVGTDGITPSGGPNLPEKGTGQTPPVPTKVPEIGQPQAQPPPCGLQTIKDPRCWHGQAP